MTGKYFLMPVDNNDKDFIALKEEMKTNNKLLKGMTSGEKGLVFIVDMEEYLSFIRRCR